MVYDFDVTSDWHQLCLYKGQSTTEPTIVKIPLSGIVLTALLGSTLRATTICMISGTIFSPAS